MRRKAWTFVAVAVSATAATTAGGTGDEVASAITPTEAPGVYVALQSLTRSVTERIRPSLVRIETVGGAQPGVAIALGENGDDLSNPPRRGVFVDQPGSDFVVADGPTTGLVYSSDGYIIASSFNFVRKPALITVTLVDGRRFAADLIARDQVRKIALLKISADGLIVPSWSDDDVRVGQWAIALGLGFGGERPSVTVGIISARNRMHGSAVQTDAKLSPANYGGPLCDSSGRVIGICVPMAQRPGELAGVELYDSGVGFAIPGAFVEEIVDELKTGRSVYRGWLGIQVDPRSQNAVRIRNIADPSPMQEAGVRPGDSIVAAEGQNIRHFGHLVQTLYMIPAGETVHLCMEREGESYSVDVVLARNTELGPLPEFPESLENADPSPEPPDGDD